MTPSSNRNIVRRHQIRRDTERRALIYQFGTSEWLTRIQQENFLWPKKDRRFNDRRSEERRFDTRRIKQTFLKTRQTSHHDLLTAEEKQMLNKLIQEDQQ